MITPFNEYKLKENVDVKWKGRYCAAIISKVNENKSYNLELEIGKSLKNI